MGKQERSCEMVQHWKNVHSCTVQRKRENKTAKTSLGDENTHPHRNHTAVAQTVIGDFSQKRGASRTSTRNVDDLLLFAHITLYVHCLVFSTRLRSNISLNFHFLTDA